MPKVAIFFCVILLSSAFANSYGFTGDSIVLHQQDRPSFDSGIIDVDSDFFSPNTFKRYVVFGNSDGIDLVKKNSIYGIESDNGFFHVALLEERQASNLAAQGYHVIEDFKLDFHSVSQTGNITISDASRIGQITGSDVANTKYNVTGSGIKIAIVDTGVDFSNPDIQDSLARDDINHPIMLDPDGQGLVLTNATFFAFIDDNKIIRNYTKPLPEDMTSSVYVSKKGVFLDVSQGGKGTDIPIYNSFFPQFGSSIIFNGTLANDMKIGDDNRNYIKSQSGVYRLGVIYQGGLDGPLARIQVVPVLFVDSNVSGVYDTIIPDMSTSWEDYTRFDLKPGQKPKYDFDFTDEKPIILGSGKEFLVYDSNKDGKSDYSAGTIGAQVLDVYNAIQNKTSNVDDAIRAVNGTLLPALDPDGEFFGVMTDFMGHGTASAASIVSKGKQEYDIYNNTEKFTIRGVAPDAKIIPVKALWFGDTVYGWLWAAGFENDAHTWKFTGNTRVDVISNSWGVSNFPSFESAPGMDVLSLILSILATPHSLHDDYPGITIVSSAGNSGHGYGTIGLPNASPFGISVGATTNNVFVGYGPFKDQPRFGNSTTHYNDVVDFSSRGPGIIGDPKPDIMSIGAHGFVPSNVIKTEKNSKAESFSLFGGTSMAAPLVSGSIALLMEGMQNASQGYDPFTIKNILMSTAKDLQNDPFTQGSGLADASAALKFANAEHGTFIIHNDNSYKNLKEILDPAIESINSTDIGFAQFQLPSKSMPMTNWFAGQLDPGERSTTTFTIENPSDSPIDVTIKPEEMSLIQKNTFHGTTTTQQQDPILNKTGVYVPNYIKLSDVKPHSEVSDFFDENPIPDVSSLMVLNLNFAFSDFMNKTVDTYADDMKISSLYLYDWVDKNNDTKVLSDELSMVNRAGSWGTVQELRVSNPGEKFEGVPLVGIYPVPTRYSYWIGDTQKNSTSMDYVLSASYYQKQKWQSVWPDAETVTVPAKDSATVNITLIAPVDSQTGVYQGFVTFESQNHVARAPVSFVVTKQIDQKDTPILISGKQSDDILFGNGYTKGAFDMANRYMAGDWRQYYFEIKDDTINSAAIEISWENNDTNLSVFVMDPKGKIVQTNMPSGVFGHFLGWPSLDWLGNSLFSQGGGFFPVKNKDETSTVIFVPINQTGTYSLLTHSTLFSGNQTTEPINIAAKFSTISLDSLEENLASDISIIPDESEHPDMSNDTLSEPLPEPSEPVPKITDKSADESADFTVGIILGIIIGVAIGVTFVFVIRQKSAK
ncbi:MAG: S8 family serine peptidase [Nitrosarchaeum sp.]|nr:S8 family serine peptidase [Nitrosarchaeum sp.]